MTKQQQEFIRANSTKYSIAGLAKATNATEEEITTFITTEKLPQRKQRKLPLLFDKAKQSNGRN